MSSCDTLGSCKRFVGQREVNPEDDLKPPGLEEGIDVGVLWMVLSVKSRHAVAGPPGRWAFGDIGGYSENLAVLRGESEVSDSAAFLELPRPVNCKRLSLKKGGSHESA